VVNVDNVAPTIALGGTGLATVGLAYTLNLGAITDPGQDTVSSWVVNWGDGGAAQTYSAGGNVTHTYTASGNLTVVVGLADEDGSYANVASQGVSVSAIPTETFTIGNAPARLTLANLNAWVTAWTNANFTLTHKANAHNAAEAWTPVTLNAVSPGTLAGGDIALGDLGVSGQTAITNTVSQEIDGSEGLKVALSRTALSATLNLSSLTRSDDGLNYAEAGRVQAFDSLGNLVAEKVFSATTGTGTLAVSIASASGFASLVITSGAYDGVNFVDGAYAALDGSFGTAPFSSGGRLHGSEFLLHAVSADLVLAPTVQLSGLSEPIEENMTAMLSIPHGAFL
jgi:hypothetical protein